MRVSESSPRSAVADADRRAWQVTPPRAALAWAAAAVGPRAQVRAVRRLGFGIAQATHAVTIDDVAGHRHRLVLQRWIRPNWEVEDPGFEPAKEAVVLAAIGGGRVPVPQVVAVDPDGAASGAPALLTSRLPGRPPSDRFTARPSTMDVLGSTIPEIHRLGAGLADRPDLRAIVPAYSPFGNLERAVVPARTARPDLWAEALRVAATNVPAGRPQTLLHRDFHPGNTLWVGDTLSGVVDWSSASWGPPAADLAHLRIDVLARTSLDAAVHARTAYTRAGGDLTDARRHQLRTVFDYLTDADPFVTSAPVVARLDAFLAIVLEEPDAPDR